MLQKTPNTALRILMCVLKFLLVAFFYSSVGHGGASAYLAAFALIGMAPASMRPAALCLNVLVASIGLYKFYAHYRFYDYDAIRSSTHKAHAHYTFAV